MSSSTSSHSTPGARPALLLLGSQMETGGAQRVLLDQAGWFHDHGYPVTAAFLYDKEGLREKWQSKADFPILDLQARHPKASKLSNLLSTLAALARLFKLMRTAKFGAVETFTHHSNLFGLPLAWLAGIPLRIGSHHGRIRDFPRTLEILHSLVINSFLTSGLVAVSEQVRLQAIHEGVHTSKITVIPNGIRVPVCDAAEIVGVRRELGLQEGQPLVFSAGRLNREKGHMRLIQAVPSVNKQISGTMFVLAGDGPLRGELEAESRSLGIEKQVLFLGVRQDMPRLMASADAFVLPSRSEGLPMVILEAMAAGKAVVAFQVGGISEVIHHGETGLLVPPDDIEGLAGAICRVLSDPTQRMSLGSAARKLALEKYSFEKMCLAYAWRLDPARAGEFA